MSGIILGIDLGTTNSVVAVADGEQVTVLADEAGNRLIPSVVSFHPERRILVGEEARDRRLIDAKNTVYSIKRLIGRPFKSPEVATARSRFAFELTESGSGGVVVSVRDETYTLTEISAFVLREVRRIAERLLDQPCNRAVITVPANFNELQRSATKAAGQVAGLDVARIINEPTAAAVAYGCGQDHAARVAVYDLGGGTFDFTLLEMEGDVVEVVSTAGDSFLGGDDIDLLVAEAMATQFADKHGWDPRNDLQAFERVRAAAEWAKCSLWQKPEVKLAIEELAYDGDGRPLDLDFSITRDQLNELILPTITRTFDTIQAALREPNLKAKDIDTVILVGGSTRLHLVREMVAHYFDAEPRTDIDPDLVVAHGAAIHGYSIAGWTDSAPPTRLQIATPSPEELRSAREAEQQRAASLPRQPAFAPTPSRADKAPRRQPPTAPPPVPDLPELPDAIGEGPGQLLTVAYFDDDATVTNTPDELEAALAQDEASPWRPSKGAPPSVPARRSGLELELELDDAGEDFIAIPLDDERVAAKAPDLRGSSDDLLPLPLDDDDADIRADGPAGEIIGRRSSDRTFDAASIERELERFSVADDAATSLAPPDELSQPVINMGRMNAPLLMDVTPHSLGIETAGGFTQRIIGRLTPIPVEQTRLFTTARDDQPTVIVRVCQGESRAFAENQYLGDLELSELRPGRRGSVRIEVTFMLDASGVLHVRAVDADTGQEQRIQINLLGGFDEAEVADMKARHDQAFAER